MMSSEKVVDTLCEIKGDQLALDVVMASLTQVMEPQLRERWLRSLDSSAEFAATVLMNTAVSDITIETFSREVSRWRRLLVRQQCPRPATLASGAAAPQAE